MPSGQVKREPAVLSIKKRMSFATVAGVLAMAGSAIASSPAFAFHLTYGSSTGAAIPPGTPYTASSGLISFQNAAGNATYLSCPSSTLSGQTINSTGGTTGTAQGLSVTSGSFPSRGGSTCDVFAAGTTTPITVTGHFSPAWQIQPLATTSSPNVFTGQVTNISLTLNCGSNTNTYAGTLSSGGTETNQYTGPGKGSIITLADASKLTLTSGTCALPTTVYVSGTYTLNTLGGSTVTATNNIWENND